jgi:hypothetical protein
MSLYAAIMSQPDGPERLKRAQERYDALRPSCPEHPADTVWSCDPDGERTGDRHCTSCQWVWLGGHGLPN